MLAMLAVMIQNSYICKKKKRVKSRLRAIGMQKRFLNVFFYAPKDERVPFKSSIVGKIN